MAKLELLGEVFKSIQTSIEVLGIIYNKVDVHVKYEYTMNPLYTGSSTYIVTGINMYYTHVLGAEPKVCPEGIDHDEVYDLLVSYLLPELYEAIYVDLTSEGTT